MVERALYAELMRQLGTIRGVRRELSRVLPAGCSSTTADILVLLGSDGNIRITKLAELLAMDMSVVSRHVSHLAAMGWIDRTADPADRRSRVLHLTPTGRALLAELGDSTARSLARRLSEWRDEDVERLTWLMARLRASFDDAGTEEGPALEVPAASRLARTCTSTAAVQGREVS
ncbi:MarR family winged helix-turn-helix transcriptional regulator [Streptomyces sp. NPDC059459]|uniref:MarR family winged helix-turn-helix transcriptional regulator n=1 Tax=Streptomyces sp. NPDC059459 TaxID=3346839 RepID=UPI0036AC190F